MPSLTELLHQNPALREKLRDSFIPQTQSLTQAWAGTPQSQREWGEHCVKAVLSLDLWLSKRTGPTPIKNVCLAAAHLRSAIHEKMRGEKNYAASRFESADRVLFTVVEPRSRYADQFNEISDHFLKLARMQTSDAIKKDAFSFYVTGCPSLLIDDKLQDIATKESLMVISLQHRFAHRGESIRLTQAYYYLWFIQSQKVVSYYFCLNNPHKKDIDSAFQAMDDLQLDVWNQPSLTETDFNRKLSTFLWLFYQTSPFEAGSASIAEILLKLCLLRRYQENAPLFIQPGISLDFRAMLGTLDSFQAVFKSLLKQQPASREAIEAAYNLPVPEGMSLLVQSGARALTQARKEKTDIECNDFDDLFYVGDTKPLLQPRAEPIAETIKLYCDDLKKLELQKLQQKQASSSKIKMK